jgi:hypothetical protein
MRIFLEIGLVFVGIVFVILSRCESNRHRFIGRVCGTFEIIDSRRSVGYLVELLE